MSLGMERYRLGTKTTMASTTIAEGGTTGNMVVADFSALLGSDRGKVRIVAVGVWCSLADAGSITLRSGATGTGRQVAPKIQFAEADDRFRAARLPLDDGQDLVADIALEAAAPVGGTDAEVLVEYLEESS